MNKTTLALIASLPLMVTPLVQAVSVSTSPVGFINVTIKGNASGSGLTGISVPMLPQVLYSGTISGASNQEITDDAATWTLDQFKVLDSNGVATNYVEITSNAADSSTVGLTFDIYGNTVDGALSVSGDPSGLDGASYVIRSYQTIGSILGGNNKAGLKAGPNFSSADIIYKIGVTSIETGELGWQIYYFKTATFFDPNTGWKKVGGIADADYSDVVIRPNEGLIVKRQDPDDIQLTIAGSIKTNTSQTNIFGGDGYNVVAFSYPVDRSLAQLNLYSSDNTLLAGGANAESADRIYYIDDDGNFQIFYYKTASFFDSTEGWRKVGEAGDQANAIIKAGTSIVVHRRQADGFTWSAAVPF